VDRARQEDLAVADVLVGRGQQHAAVEDELRALLFLALEGFDVDLRVAIVLAEFDARRQFHALAHRGGCLRTGGREYAGRHHSTPCCFHCHPGYLEKA
jgi:hypothetical protein